MDSTPLDKMSWHFLLLILQRTDFSEPWYGFGHATLALTEVIKAAKRKAANDVLKEDILIGVLKEKHYEMV